MSDPAVHHLDLTARDRPAPKADASMLDLLWETLEEDTEQPPLTLGVPRRPKVSITFDVNIDWEMYKAWRKKATKRNRRSEEETDLLALACIVVANQCQAILIEGEEPTVDGQPLTFATPLLRERLNAPSPSAAVRILYGNDGHVLATSDSIVRAAGFLDEVEEPDPTQT